MVKVGTAKHVSGTWFRNMVISLLVAGTLAIVGFGYGPLSAYAAEGDPVQPVEPEHSKSLQVNDDGTYTISLSVTGDADEDEQEAGKVNVIILYDVSQSMTNRVNGSSGPRRADAAEDVVHDFLVNLAHYQNSDRSNIQAALIRFSVNASQLSGWTNNINTDNQSLANMFGDGGAYNSAKLSYSNMGSQNMGTNWEHPLRLAESLAENPPLDGPTFIILLTDGAPTKDGTNNQSGANPNQAWYNLRGYYNSATDEARAIEVMGDDTPDDTSDDRTLFGIYAYGNEADLLDDLLYYANNGEHRTVGSTNVMTAPANNQSHDYGETEAASNYFNANNTQDLNNAIDKIFKQIVESMGISEVKMKDGTTNHVQVGSESVDLVDVIDGTYEYWMSIPLLDGKFTKWEIIDGSSVEVTYTVTDLGNDQVQVSWPSGSGTQSVMVKGSATSSNFEYKWEEAQPFYDFAPPAASLDPNTGAVNWDLSGVGTLLDGVKYTVKFDVYPTQTALDYKARIDNGESYESVVPEEARDYFHPDGTLETNTEATLTYKDTRADNPGPYTTDPFPNPPAVSTSSETMTVTKGWEGGDPPTGLTLEMDVLADGNTEEPFAELELGPDPNWTQEIHVSFGMIENDEVLPSAPGHDFSFAELPSMQYRWELVAPVVHPMIIDGVKTMLVKVDEEKGYVPAEGAKTYTIGEGTYYVDETVASLSATNHRRSNLNLKKIVSGEGAPEDATFPFELTIQNSKEQTSGDPDDINSDYYVWFSVQDTNNPDPETGKFPIVKDITTNATPEEGNTGYFYAPSSSKITVDMKAGWNLRVTNLPSGTTYTFAEGNADGFKFISAESTGADDKTFDGETTPKTATGTIVTYNANAYEVTFTNKYEETNVTVTKVWDDDSNYDNVRPSTTDFAQYLTLNADGTAVTDVTPTIEADPDDTDKYIVTWTGLPTFSETGEDVVYTVTESQVPDYEAPDYGENKTSAENGGTITNKHEKETVDVTVTKEWDDDDDVAGMRPTSLTVTLYADDVATDTTKTLTADGNWTATAEGLTKNNQGGTAIEYTWEEDEDALPEGYSQKSNTTSGTATTITNEFTLPTVDVTITKVWDDSSDNDGIRPSADEFKAMLTLSNGTTTVTSVTPTVEADPEDSNKYIVTWVGLPKYANNELITYTVTESQITNYEVPDYGEGKTYAENGGTITNKHNIETIEITVTKVWVGPHDSATINLMNGSTKVDSVVLSDENENTYTFTNLPKKEDGVDIDYTIQEEVSDKYHAGEPTGSIEQGFTITNTHLANGEVQIKVTKAVEGRATQEAGMFEFTMQADTEGAPMPDGTVDGVKTATNAANGDVDFGTIKFTQDDIYKNASTGDDETAGSGGETGGSEGSGDEGTEPAMKAVGSDAVIDGAADGDVDAAADGATNVDVDADNDNTVKGKADGESGNEDDDDADGPDADDQVRAADDETAEYSATFTYTIKETKGDAPGYTYSNEPITVTVTVTDTGADELDVSVEYDPDDKTITNTYEAEGSYKFKGTKELTGADLEEGQFTFELKDESGSSIGTATNKADGTFEFDAIKYTQEDADKTFTYTVIEQAGNDSNITYDDTEYTIKLKATDNGKGEIVPEVVSGDADSIVFNNEYKEPEPITSDPPVKKVVTGDKPSTDGTFRFEMKAVSEGAPMPEGSKDGVKTVEIVGSGEYEFGVMTYEEAGTYVYEISEVDGGIAGYTYDTTKYTLTVVVEEDENGNLTKTETIVDQSGKSADMAVFTNEYKSDDMPGTGDTTWQGIAAAAVVAIAAGVVAVGANRRRRDQ